MMGIRVSLAQLITSVFDDRFEPSCNDKGLTALPSVSSYCKAGNGYLLVSVITLDAMIDGAVTHDGPTDAGELVGQSDNHNVAVRPAL